MRVLVTNPSPDARGGARSAQVEQTTPTFASDEEAADYYIGCQRAYEDERYPDEKWGPSNQRPSDMMRGLVKPLPKIIEFNEWPQDPAPCPNCGDTHLSCPDHPDQPAATNFDMLTPRQQRQITGNIDGLKTGLGTLGRRLDERSREHDHGTIVECHPCKRGDLREVKAKYKGNGWLTVKGVCAGCVAYDKAVA